MTTLKIDVNNKKRILITIDRKSGNIIEGQSDSTIIKRVDVAGIHDECIYCVDDTCIDDTCEHDEGINLYCVGYWYYRTNSPDHSDTYLRYERNVCPVWNPTPIGLSSLGHD